MADERTPSYLGISNFAFPNKPSVLDVKKASVAETEAMKKIALGSDNEINTLATARIQSNDLAFSPVSRDLRQLDRAQLAAKYGEAGLQAASRYDDAYGTITDMKSRERETGDVLKDSALTGVKAVANMAGAVAEVANYVVFGPSDPKGEGLRTKTKMAVSDTISDALKWVDEGTNENSSELMQWRRAQHAIEAGLNNADTEAAYQRDLEAGVAPVNAWLGKQWRNAKDTISNYSDDPMMMGDLAVNGATSLVPFGIAARVIGGAGAAQALVRSGAAATTAEATAMLGTQAGKAFLAQRAAAAVPAMSAVVEGGAGSLQARQEILAMNPDQLAGTPQFDELVAGGMEPETARDLLAQQAGDAALPVSGAIGGLAGMIAPAFEVAPMRALTSGKLGSSLLSAGANVAKEGVEEFIQEGGNQFGANVGLKYGAGLDVALDRDVVQSGMEGAMGGAMTSGAMQTPAAVVGTVKETLGTAFGAAKTRLDTMTKKITADGPVGEEALNAAGDVIRSGADALAAEVAASKPATQPTTPAGMEAQGGVPQADPAASAAMTAGVDQEQTEPYQTTAPADAPKASPLETVAATVNKAAYASPEETEHYAALFGEEISAKVASNPNRPVDRETVVRSAGKAVLNQENPEEVRIVSALTLMLNLDSMNRLSSDEVRGAVRELPADSTARKTVTAVTKASNLLKSSEGVVAAEKLISELSPEVLDTFLAPQVEAAETMDKEGKSDVLQLLEVVSRVNQGAVPSKYFEKVRNKIDPTKVDPVTVSSLEASSAIASEIESAATAKAALNEQRAAEIDTLPEEEAVSEKTEEFAPSDLVRNEVLFTGHGSLPSLTEHRRRIGDAVAAGKTEAAKEHLRSALKFAITMRNKVQAINTSAEKGGNGVNEGYDAFGQDGTQFFYKRGAGVKLSSSTSRAFAQDAWIDANLVVNSYNAMVKAYGKVLSLPQDKDLTIKLPELDQRITSYGTPNQTTPTAVEEFTKVTLPANPSGSNNYLMKDQAKSDMANKFIGQGSVGSSTDRYAQAWGERANTGSYTAEDRVFVSAEGGRAGRLDPDFAEIEKATAAGATIITDKPEDRERGYNVGERQVAQFLQQQNYDEQEPGIWTKKQEAPKAIKPGPRKIGGMSDAALAAEEANRPKVNVWYGSNENAELSNLAERPFEYEGKRYRSVEHAYQSLKSGEFDAKTSNLYITSKPGSKIPGRKGTKTEGDWNLGLMEDLVRASFAANPKAQEALRATGNAKITHTQDRGIWGTAFPMILEKVRSELPPVEETRDANQSEDEAAPKPKKLSKAEIGYNGLKSLLLAPVNQINRFLNAFKPAKTEASLLLHLDPAAHILENLGELQELEGSALQFALSYDQTQELEKLLGEHMPQMVQEFRNRFVKAIPAGEKNNDLNSFLNPDKNYLGMENLYPANFLMEDPETGELTLSEPVLQASFMAALQWMMEDGSRGQKVLDDEQIAKRLGLPRDTRITNKMKEAVSAGTLAQSVYSDVARNLRTLLGVEPDLTVTASHTQGILTAMASNAVSILSSMGALTKTTKDIRIKGEKGPREIVTYRLKDAKASEIVKSIKAFSNAPDLFTQIFAPDSAKVRYIGRPPRVVAQKLIRQPFSRISPKQEQVISRLQKVEWHVNQPLFRSVELIGSNFLAEMLGFIQITDENRDSFNKKDLLSIEGKNASLKNGLSGVQGYIDEVDALAEAQGLSREEVAIFFDYKFSSVGRLQQQGPITPQGDKIMRELVTATNAVLDMNDPTQEFNFWLTMAQNLGVKVDKQPMEKSVQEAKDLISGSLAPAVAILMDAASDNKSLSAGDQSAFRNAITASGVTFTMKVFHALQVAAQLEQAKLQGGTALSQFKTSLSFEADGVTDGPINAMVHMKTGLPNEAYIRNLAKGGWFFTDTPKTIQQQKLEDNVDLYEQATIAFSSVMQALLNDIPEGNHATVLAMLRTLDALMPDFTLADPAVSDVSKVSFVAKRGLLKNPLTVFIYGSSVDGIAGKLVSILEDELASVLTEISQSGKSWNEHPLFANRPKLVEDLSHLLGANVAGLLNRPADFVMTDEQADSLAMIVSEFFADPMTKAIDLVTGKLSENMKLTQRASQVQTRIFQDLFDARVKARRKEMVNAGELFGKQLLPEGELIKIFRELLKVAPVYDTEDMEFYISGKSSWASDTPVSKDLQGKNTATADLLSPSEASVKVSPYLTIGTGDGQMVLTIYADGTSKLDMTLPVFDGIEIGIDNMVEASAEINAAVFKGWMESNPFRSVSDGFEQMLRNVTLKDLSPAALKSIEKTLRIKHGNVESKDLFGLLSQLKNKADEVDARKKAMARLNSFTDHMGGAGSPHQNKGEKIGEASTAKIADMMTKLYYEELAKIEEAKKPEQVASRQKIKARLGKLGEPVSGYKGVIAFGVEGLKMLVSKEMGASKEQVELAQLILDNPSMLFFQFLQGTAKELTRLKAEWYPWLGDTPIEEGQTAVFSDVVFLTKADPETALHEAIHAWVSKSIQQYYANPESVPEYIRATVKRLEALKEQFLSLDPTRFDKATRAAMDLARGEITNDKYDAAHQMDEFLAYVLSNQLLIKALDKQKIHQNKLAQIANKVLQLLQNMLRIKTTPGKTMLSNVRFNAEILGDYAAQNRIWEINRETEVLLNKIDPEGQRLENIERRFLGQLEAQLMEDRPKDDKNGEQTLFDMEVDAQLRQSQSAAKRVGHNGFAMTQREEDAFMAVHAGIYVTSKLDAAAFSRMAEIYAHAVPQLTSEAFLKAEGIDPAQATRAEMIKARIRAGVFKGNTGIRSNSKNQTDILATFFALAQVNTDFRKMLEEMSMPKESILKVDSADRAVAMLTQSAYDKLVDLSLSRKKQPKSVKGQLDLLGHVLSEVKTQNRLMATMDKFTALNKSEEFLSGKLKAGTKKAVEFFDRKQGAALSKYAQGAYGAAALIASLGSKETSDASAGWMTSLFNKPEGLHTARALIRDLIGSTKSTKELYKILRKVRAEIDAVRQDFREQVPGLLAKGFTRKLSRSEWSHLHAVLGAADMLVFGRDKAMAFFKDPSLLAQEKASLETRLKTLGGKNAGLYLQKAKALAIYMTKREVTSNNLAMNALSIARLNGEPSYGALRVTKELVQVIDELTSILAWEMTDDAAKATVEALAKTQEEGLRKVTGFHATNRALEQQKMDVTTVDSKSYRVARNNGLKGYVPSLVEEGNKVIVRDVRLHTQLTMTGWTKIGDYEGDANEDYLGKRAYYISETAGRNAFRQGAAQTVHALCNGVDIRTGLMHNSDMGGAILGADAKIIRNQRDSYGVDHNLPAGEHLIPVFDENGSIMGFQLPIKPEMSARLQKDTNLARMLGIWSGRIVEENMADDLNHELLLFLKEFHDKHKDNPLGQGEWVNVADPKTKDRVVKDAWQTMGWKIKEDAAEIFGKENFFPVRRDMLDDALGYRAAGVSDAWTGISRMSPTAQKALRNGATLIAGKHAYPWLKKAEGGVQSLVSYAKQNIIVRSITLTVQNVASNQLYLVYAHGMNPLRVVSKSREKFIEITTLVKNREEILKLKVDLVAVANDPDKVKVINRRIRVLEDANSKFSIAPLIEANEFGVISESLTEADMEIREGRLASYIEKVVNKLPETAVGIVKTAVATKDSELFKVLNRGVQYGDFVAKAVLYDHLTQTKGMTSEEALDVISEEFVDYNRLPGRGRDFLESIGAIWFFNYTLRITKIMMKTLRDRPLTALLMLGGAIPTFGIDTVFESSLPSKILGDGLDYKIGPEMGIDGLFVHPWNALMG